MADKNCTNCVHKHDVLPADCSVCWNMDHYKGKKYRAGMYGGKFMPMHVGHVHCLERAIEMCDTVYLILFTNGNQEQKIASDDHRDMLSIASRIQQLYRVAGQYDCVIPLVIDVSSCRKEDGSEDWDKETPLVLNTCGKFDAVFGSEPSYAPYFARAYPWADYVIVDTGRTEVPVSATEIRNMNEEEAKKWIV